MIIGSHNSWSYLPVRRWWMKPIAFTARCQNVDIQEQHELGIRCFDLRVRFDKGRIILVHGIVEYEYNLTELFSNLRWLNKQGKCYVRILHDVRNKRQLESSDSVEFRWFCSMLEKTYTHIRFWCGRNLYDWNKDYDFGIYPTCEEKYGSVSNHKWLYVWWPWLYARLHNKNLRAKETDKEILLIDYVNI